MQFSEGVILTPAVNTLLADTGPRTAGEWVTTFLLGATIATRVRIEVRNAANDDTVFSHEIGLVANVVLPISQLKIFLEEEERIRVVQAVAMATGGTQASIFTS